MKGVLITNGLIVTARDTFPGEIYIEGEKIIKIGECLTVPEGVEVIDAENNLVMPGAVDAHTHVDITVGGIKVSDGWFEATKAAAFGGVTSLIEHPGFGANGCSLFEQFELYCKNAAKESVIDYGIHGVFQHWNDDIAAQIPHLVAKGCTSFKAYTTYDGKLNTWERLKALKCLKQAGGLLTVHCESHEVLAYLGNKYSLESSHLPSSHFLSRPDYCEEESISEMIALAKAVGAPLYIVHLSTKAGLERIIEAKEQGLQVIAETCPQYLLLNNECYDQEFNQAIKYVMAPPLRTSEDQKALWEAVIDGHINVVATDHCSFSWQIKRERAQNNIFKSPGGIPGIETRLPIMYSEGVIKRGLSLNRLVELCSTAPARIFGLENKGDLAPGYDADIVIFNPNKTKILSCETLHQQVDYTPYEGLYVSGWPEKVFLRGNLIINKEEFCGNKGSAKYLARGKYYAINRGE